jgi:hypothetical protein
MKMDGINGAIIKDENIEFLSIDSENETRKVCYYKNLSIDLI